MADAIDNLKFDIILDDSTFNATIERDIQKAQDLNAQLSNILQAKVETKNVFTSDAVKAAQDVANALKSIAGVNLTPKEIFSQATVTSAKEVETTLKSILDQLNKMPTATTNFSVGVKGVNSQLHESAKYLNDLQRLTGITFGIVGIRQFLSSLVEVTGQFEVQQMALRSMIGDAEKADSIFKELRKNALESPYTFQDLSKYAKQLTAFNIDADKLVETEKMLADVAAGLGVDMGRIILAYGQVKAAGVLKGTELRQFTEAGVPLLQSLADQIERTEGKTISLSQVFDRISKKQIPFEMVEQAFRDMTTEGGKFYNMQEVLVETLQGKIGKLRDVWQQALYDLGQANEGLLKGTVDTITNIVSHLSEMGGIIKTVVVGFGAYYTALALVAVKSKAIDFWNISKALIATATGSKAAASGLSMMANAGKSVAVAFGWIGVISVALIEIIKYFKDTKAAHDALTDSIAKASNSISTEQEELKKLVTVAKDESKSMEQRTDAIDVINAKYGEYLNKLGIEKVSVDNLATSYDLLRDAIANKYLEQLKEQTVGVAQADLNDARTGLNKFNADILKNAIGNAQGRGYIQGEVERFIADHPLFDRDALYSSIVDIYKKYGITLKSGEQGNLFKLVEDFKTAGATLKTAEKDFNDFAKGYGNALDLFKKNDETTKNGGSTWTPTSKGKSEAQKEIEARIKLLEKVKDAADQLRPYFATGDEMTDNSVLSAVVSNIFGENIDVETVEDKIVELADSLAKFGEDARRYGENVKAGLGKDTVSLTKAWFKETEKQAKALETWNKEKRKWEKDWGGNFSGIEYDINQLIRGYNDEEKKIDDEYLDALKKLEEGHKGNAEAIEEEAENLRHLREARSLANLTETQEKLRDLSKKYVTDATSGLSLTDWGDKSLGQVVDIYRQLKDFASSDIELSGELQDAILETGLSIEEFRKLCSKEYGIMTDEAKKELEKKLASSFKKVADNLTKAISKVKEFADAFGSESLSALADDLSFSINAVSSALEGFVSGGVPGLVVSVVSSYVNEVSKIITANAQLKESIRQAAEEGRMANYDWMLSDRTSSVFGEDSWQKVQDANKVIKELQELTDANREAAKNKSFDTSSKAKWWEWTNIITAPIALVKTLTTSNETLGSMAKKLNRSLYDSYGNLNAETLQAILDTYGDLTKKEKEWIEQAINNSNKYADAVKQLSEVLESVFGDIASSAADTIVDQWIEAGNAALDYAEILDDVARKYAKMLIESAILQRVLTQEEADKVAEKFASGDTSGAMKMIADDMEQIAQMAPYLESVLTALDPYFIHDEETSGSDSSSLGSGIKSITEDTANLLASYINAIRADVSVMRGLQQSGWQDVKAILGFVQSPTLSDYLAQTAANTYDLAQSNARILFELQSVIGAGSNGGIVVRTEVV